MSRKTKVVGFSLPPEINNQVEEYLQRTHKTRSEFIRETIGSFFANSTQEDISEKDLASLLKSYWDIRSNAGIEIVPIVLAIITNSKGKVLIGARKVEDKWVDNLTWVFPGGKLNSLVMEDEVKRLVLEETGLEVSVNQLIASRIHPDSGFKRVQIVALYFDCSIDNGKDIIPGGSLDKLEWINPLDVFKYFTTSTCDEVTKFLTMIEKGSGSK
jgi:8-oxo-dGTP pyrophosphatase MutT (NUDIX family)